MKLTNKVVKWAKENDKVAHVLLSALITAALFCLVHVFGFGLFMSVVLAYLGLNLIGLVKEMRDHFKGISKFDLDNITANNIGSMAALCILAMLVV